MRNRALSRQLPDWWGGPPVRGRRPRRPAGALLDADADVSAAGCGRPARTGGSAPPRKPSVFSTLSVATTAQSAAGYRPLSPRIPVPAGRPFFAGTPPRKIAGPTPATPPDGWTAPAFPAFRLPPPT